MEAETEEHPRSEVHRCNRKEIGGGADELSEADERRSLAGQAENT